MSVRKWTPPVIQDYFHDHLLKTKEEECFRNKAEEFWKRGTWFNIYVRLDSEGKKMILAVPRLTQKEFDELEIKENYIKQWEEIEYICQYPHETWEKAIGEYELYSKIHEYDATDCFTKTEFFPERNYIWFPKDKISYKGKKEGENYCNKHIVFKTLMYSYLRSEINN